MKTPDKHELKSYEKGFDKFSRHHLLGCIAGCVRLIPVEKEFDSKDFQFSKNSYVYLSIAGDTGATLYLNKNKKLNEGEWTFVFATMAVLLALDLYSKKKIFSLLQEKCHILFAANYVYEVLGMRDLPSEWGGYFKIAEEISFKNENSVFEQMKEQPKLHEFLFNFLNFEDLSIGNKDKNEYLFRGNAYKTFSEIFATNLITQAKRTILLKSNPDLSEEDIKLQALPVYKARKWFITHYPLLSALATSFEVREDLQYCHRYNIEIGAVSAREKLIVINPSAHLSEEGMKFVIAHEILHVALAHSSRKLGRDHLLWNLACDFVINHWLVEMNVGVPPEGVFLDRELANKSADEIYLMISQDVRLRKKMMTLRSKNAGMNYSDNASKNNYNKKNQNACDMLDEDPKYFSEFEDACKKALLRGLFVHENIGRGFVPGSLEEEIKLINQPPIPWQVELARWLSERFPLEDSKRTYARASRRQSSSPDIPRPKYIKPEEEKHSRTFGVIMDTSASMDTNLLGKCLGAIVSYASAQEVKQIRLVFCDAQTYDEGYIDLEKLIHKFRVKGRGGTVLQQAVNYLENIHDFPPTAPILILTDGEFESDLTVKRDHAFLIPINTYLPIMPKGEVFKFK